MPFPRSVPHKRAFFTQAFSISTPPPFQCSHCHLRSFSNSVGQVPYANRKRWHCPRGRGHACPWRDPEDTLKTATGWYPEPSFPHPRLQSTTEGVWGTSWMSTRWPRAHSGTARPPVLTWDVTHRQATQSQTKGTIPGPVGALLFRMPLSVLEYQKMLI